MRDTRTSIGAANLWGFYFPQRIYERAFQGGRTPDLALTMGVLCLLS